MYSLIDADKAKGINKNVVKKIRNEKYIVLFNTKMVRHKMKRNQSKLHRTGTYVCEFLCLVLMIKNMY